MAARQDDAGSEACVGAGASTDSAAAPYAGPAFKSSRIKRLMQRDEDVGKIATATPVLVARALECLMTDVLKAAADVAVARSTKTVTPAHLKGAIDTHDHFDFLRPTVAAVPSLQDADAAKLKAKKAKAKRPRTASTSAPRSASRKKSKAEPPGSPAAPPPDLVALAPPAHEMPSVSIDSIRSAANDEEDDYDEDDDEDEDGETGADTEGAAEPQAPPQPVAALPTPAAKDAPNEPCDSSSRVSVQALLS